MIYQKTRRVETVEEHLGVTVAEPFLWLESDPEQDAEVADGVVEQNVTSRPYLYDLEGHDVFQ